jgi:hypothetical protein
MNTQSAVEQKSSTQYPAAKPGNGEPAGGPGTLPVPEQPGDAEQKLKSERVQEELKAMTGWAATQGETAVERVKTFATPEIAEAPRFA